MIFCIFFSDCSDDVCVLSAIGTAALINQQFTMSEGTRNAAITPRDPENRDFLKDVRQMSIGSQKVGDNESDTKNAHTPTGCYLCHIPHSKLTLPVNGKMRKCAVCK